MSEMSEVFADLRKAKQAKKRSNLAASTRMLQESGVNFESHNMGIHLVIKMNDKIIDFWPSTGLWWIRGTSNKRRGIEKLIRHVKLEKL